MNIHISKEIHPFIIESHEVGTTNLKTTPEDKLYVADNAIVKIDKVADILRQDDKEEYYLSDFE